MNWQDYRQRYGAFLTSLQQTEMIHYHAGISIPNLPTKVKEEEKSEIPFLVNFLRETIISSLLDWKTDHTLLEMEPILRLVFDGKRERVLASHELIMLVAHLEAFVADSLSTIWRSNLDILEKTASGKRAMNKCAVNKLAEVSDSILDSVIEQTLWELLRNSPDAYLAYFEHKLSVSINVDRKLLYRASLDRNAIVHNGGLISQEKYINKLNSTEQAGLIAGQEIRIDSEYVTEVFNLIQSTGESLFEQLSKSYFDISQPLKATERIVRRQLPNLDEHPLQDFAKEAIKNMGGPDKAIRKWQETVAEMHRLLDKKQKGEN